MLDVELPDAGFYLWADVRRSGLSDTEFARRLYADYNVTVLPGSYLARDAHGVNPGRDRVRMALVAEVDEGLEAAQRIVQFCNEFTNSSTPEDHHDPTTANLIDTAWEHRADINPANGNAELRDAVDHVIAGLDDGSMRVAQKDRRRLGHQPVDEESGAAVVPPGKQRRHAVGGTMQFYDKVPTKFADYTSEDFAKGGFRVVPPAVARRGSFIGKNVVLMPSYVNIGAYVDEGTMVDTWATVGSCAQIGKNVHLSGGVGIGGVLEPMQANPTIIEDNCFIGARSEIVEGVIVEENSVISMGVYIGQSTKIYDRETGEVTYGRVPAGSVVVSGNLPSEDGKYSLYCAVIVKRVDAQTRSKTGINELLRGI